MNLRSLLAPRHVWLDGVLITGILAVANALLAPGDPGWLQVNPSPWILLPMLLGARYGFGPGTAGALVAVTAVAGVLTLTGRARHPTDVVQAHIYFFSSLVVIGAVAGELWSYFRRRIAQAEAAGESLRGKLRRLDADAIVLREAKDELDRVTAARDGEISSFDAELRRLYACLPATLPGEILQLLKRQARVSDAALYRAPADGDPARESWVRFAHIGREDNLPPEIVLRDHAMAEHAYRNQSLVTLPEIQTQEPVEGERALMAAPLPGADGRARAMLVVADMPFIAFTPTAANLISLVCAWSGGVLELAEGAAGRYRLVAGRESQRVFFEPHFRHLARLAQTASRKHRLPSAMVELSMPDRVAAEAQAGFERVVLGAVRSGDFVMQPNRPYPALIILLPLAGERGTDIFIERCLEFCRRHGIGRDDLRVKRVNLGAVDSIDDVLKAFANPEGAADA